MNSVVRARRVPSLKLALGVLLVVWGSGCGGAASPTSQSAVTMDIHTDSRLIQGAWHLESYHPDASLDPLTGGLLASEQPTMLITFGPNNMKIDGSIVHTQRGYYVSNASGLQFEMVILDVNSGERDVVDATFDQPDHLVFRSMTTPWNGTGALRRVSAPSP